MVGASSTGFEEYEYKFTPKLKKTFGPYSVWLFYQEGDTAGEKNLQADFCVIRFK
jgi:hypothetical protein